LHKNLIEKSEYWGGGNLNIFW